MIKTTILASGILALFLLCGCTTMTAGNMASDKQTWQHPTKTDQGEIKADFDACRSASENWAMDYSRDKCQRAYSAQISSGKDRAFKECMEAKGYRFYQVLIK